MNPFLLKGYKSPEFFCNRVKESELLVTAIRNNQDITLYGYRRLGKSALIHHVFHKLEKEYKCIYSDIWGTTSVEEFTKELANGILRSKIFSKRSFSQKMMTFLKSIGASFSMGMDGLPSIDVIYKDRNHAFSSLEELYGFLNQLKEPIVLAIDEFQEIKKYENNVPFEGKLRALTQQCSNVVFLYSGSEYHLLNEIFNSYTMPFYQSTRMLSIEKIEAEPYKKFILARFKKSKRKMEPAVIDTILHLSHLHTYYVQAIFNFLFSLEILPQTNEEFFPLYRDFILEKSVFYRELPERLTKQQFEIVKGFGKIGIVSTPTSVDFMEKVKIRSSSSMHRAINSLLEKHVIIKDTKGYRLYDVFLEHFLKFTL